MSESIAPPQNQHPPEEAELSTGEWLKEFFKGVGQAWKKVTWPTRRQLLVQVLITIAVSAFATTLIWGFDTVYSFLIATFVKG